MSDLFSVLVEVLQAGMFTVAQSLGGSLPAAILAVTFALRIALLPLTYRVALRARSHARKIRDLKPRLERLRAAHADDPRRLSEATLELYRSKGLTPVDPAVIGGTLVQAPIFAAFFQAVRGLVPTLTGHRFLWIRDLALPSPLLGMMAAGLVFLSTLLMAPGAEQPGWARTLPAAMTLTMLLFFSSAFGLYMLASGGVGVLQALLVRRAESRLSR
jgi:YidC/Oxa1 family membrane protein insertase